MYDGRTYTAATATLCTNTLSQGLLIFKPCSSCTSMSLFSAIVLGVATFVATVRAGAHQLSPANPCSNLPLVLRSVHILH